MVLLNTLRRGLFVAFVPLVFLNVVRSEQYPDKSRIGSSFENFGDVGKLLTFQMQTRSEYQTVLSNIKYSLSKQPFIGINKVVGNDFDIYPSKFEKILDSSGIPQLQAEGRVTNQKAEFVPLDSGKITLKKVKSANASVGKEYVSQESAAAEFSEAYQSAESLGRATDIDSNTTQDSSSSDPVTAWILQATTAPSSNITEQCLQDNLYIFSNASTGEQWALQFLDSWGKPGSGLLKGQLKFVGDYHQCRSSRTPSTNESTSGFSGDYCVVAFAPTSNLPGNFVNILGSFSLVEIGSCMPDTCTAEDIFIIFQQGLAIVNLTSTLTVSSVDCKTDFREYTTASIVAIIFLSIIAVLMALGTTYDILFIQMPVWFTNRIPNVRKSTPQKLSNPNDYRDNDNEEANTISSSIHENELGKNGGDYRVHKREMNGGTQLSEYTEDIPLLTKAVGKPQKWRQFRGILGKVILAFSVYTNGQKALNTSQTPGSLTAIHGIRFLSMSWVILGHIYIFEVTIFKNLATEMPALLNRWTFDAISNAVVSVDTFFALSGLLIAYIIIPEIQEKGWKINWAIFYFHRFWRLTPPYMLVLLVTLGLQRFMGSGALWASTQPPDKTYCEDNWWTNLLYINNFINTDKLCMAHSWYLANDMQFYILSPLLTVPFYFNVKAGVGSCLLFLTVSWITTGALSTENKWTPTILTGVTSTQATLGWQHYYYMAPYCRIGPFIIGILTGYLLAVTKGLLHLKWYVVIIGWTAAIAAGLAIVYGIHDDITGENPASVGVAALYNTVARSAWGACVCWVIVACVSGYGGPVNALLSWSPFVFLGRLTYISYLIHPTVIRVYFENMEQLFYLNETNMVISFLGVLVFTNMTSFVLMLAFESPMIGLEKVFLRRH